MTTLSGEIPTSWWRPDRPPPALAATFGEPAGAAPFWMLVALTAIMFLAPQTYLPVLASLRIALLTALLAFATFAFDRLKQGRRVFAVGDEMWWCLALVAWAVVTVPFSKWPGGSVNVLTDLYFKSVIVFWLLGNIVRHERALHRLTWVLSLIAIPLALVGIKHFFAGDFSLPGTSAEQRIIGYDAGLVKNPNDLALVLNMILPLTVALVHTEKSRALRLLLAAIICCEAGGIVATFSRSGFLTLSVIGILHLWQFRRRASAGWMWLAVSAGLVALLVAPGAYVQRLNTIFDKDADPTGSAQARWSDQVLAVGYVEEHPIIGAGAGSDVLVMNDLRGPKWRQVHDLYLEYAIDLGLPGLALFLTLFCKCFKAVLHSSRRYAVQGTEAVADLAQGIWISLAGFAVAAFFSPIAYHVYFYYLAGLAVATRTIGGNPGGAQ